MNLVTRSPQFAQLAGRIAQSPELLAELRQAVDTNSTQAFWNRHQDLFGGASLTKNGWQALDQAVGEALHPQQLGSPTGSVKPEEGRWYSPQELGELGVAFPKAAIDAVNTFMNSQPVAFSPGFVHLADEIAGIRQVGGGDIEVRIRTGVTSDGRAENENVGLWLHKSGRSFEVTKGTIGSDGGFVYPFPTEVKPVPDEGSTVVVGGDPGAGGQVWTDPVLGLLNDAQGKPGTIEVTSAHPAYGTAQELAYNGLNDIGRALDELRFGGTVPDTIKVVGTPKEGFTLAGPEQALPENATIAWTSFSSPGTDLAGKLFVAKGPGDGGAMSYFIEVSSPDNAKGTYWLKSIDMAVYYSDSDGPQAMFA